MNESLSLTAGLLGDPGRAAILLRLMGGMALPAGELAATANVAPQTASEHLAKLVAGRLLSVERQGRHRYYRLASAEVADAVESLLVLTARPHPAHQSASANRPAIGTLEHARTCYGHLAGWLGVRIADILQQRGFIKASGAGDFAVTPSGRDWFASLHITVPPPAPSATHKKLARRCLDWTERRHHLAGVLGCALYKHFREVGWLVPVRDTRIVRVTVEGRIRLWELLRIPVG
ncbi:MAG TPA: winged helix-turn-helix domain-containing protein [Candidatus Acidoferrum sp.]|jgi:DNA-binding transcriptional ArsR family regulator